MSDPAVCCFLTSTLCAQGGRLGLPELQQHTGLSAPQLAETLAAAGPRRFLMLRGGAEVLALSDVRVCPRRECGGGCERLHLCKQHLMGRCHLRPSSCKYSHDIISAENKKVLRKHDLYGLNENELRILLLQNDTFFLPDTCQLYNTKGGVCMQQNNCSKLHVCRHFLQGECRFLTCMRSHNLLDGHALRVLETGGIDGKIALNLQNIYDYKHMEFNRERNKGNVHNYKPRGNYLKKPVVTTSKEPKVPLQTVDSTVRVPSPEGPGSTLPGQRQHQLPTGAGGKDEGKKNDSSAEASKDNKEVNCDEICVFYVWKYCKNKDKCKSVHYHLPYKWEIYDGITWKELAMMEEIEKAYCDPKTSSIADRNINFQTMTCSSSPVRRLSTPSSVTKPTFVLTTQWIWYWKNNQGQWIEYGEQGEGDSVDSPSSAVLENLYQADPVATITFQAGQHHYNLNFKEMTQTNTAFKTQRQVCRRPKFVSFEDVQKIKKGQRDSSIPNQACPSHWDQSALPDLGYKVKNAEKVDTMKYQPAPAMWCSDLLLAVEASLGKRGQPHKVFMERRTGFVFWRPTYDKIIEAVVISSMTSEYNKIKQLFHQTMKTYSILKIQRIQNPSLWKVFQWQKEKMKRENGGKEVQEKLLFHGTNISFVEAICTWNFDWRICGKNGTNYGMGSYFARDASYSHAYCQAAEKGNMMFVARVLVGDYIKGNAAYVRPPKKSLDGLWFYDSCVDDELNPSVFVVFEKHQIYPEYIIEYKKDEKIIEYKEDEKKCVIS